MSAVWEVDLPDSEKIVLLALADNANDEGGCWPSIATIAKKCSKGERTVQCAIKALCDKGHLSRIEKLGKGVTYTVHPRSGCTPAKSAPRNPRTPAAAAPTPAAAAPKPSMNHTSEAKASSVTRFELPDDIPVEAWAGFVEMRQRIRKPMTVRAMTLAVGKLHDLARDGWPPGEVLNHCTMNSYQGIFPPQRNGNGNRTSNGHGRPTRRADEIDDAAYRLGFER